MYLCVCVLTPVVGFLTVSNQSDPYLHRETNDERPKWMA